MTSNSDERLVILELKDPSTVEENHMQEISISTSEIQNWDIPLILSFQIVKVKANRSRLIQQSSYFRCLLDGSFSESTLDHVSVQWNLETAVSVLQFVHGCSINVTSNNFLVLLEAALFFGTESLLLECETWFRKSTFARGSLSPIISLDTILGVWNFSVEHGSIGFLPELCKSYIARNFAWVKSCSTFADIPYNLLYSSIEHPQLTVNSEKQLCEAILIWLASNTKSSECQSNNSGNNYFDILKKVRICLLPLGFAAGQRRDKHFSKLAYESVNAIFDLMKDCPTSLLHAITDDDFNNFRIRLTQYSENIDLSGCVHITMALLLTMPWNSDATLKKRMLHEYIELDHHRGDHSLISKKSFTAFSYEVVHKVDISKCPRLPFGDAIKWLHLVFPSLRILKASYCLHFKMEDLYYLLQKYPLIEEVDLTVDVSPVMPTKLLVLSTSAERYQSSNQAVYKALKEGLLFSNIAKGSLLSRITKLTLEGRADIDDLDLINISALSSSLFYLNIGGCTSVTDDGISKCICKCLNIHSMVVSNTSFGIDSTLALCYNCTCFDEFPGVHHDHKYSCTMAFRLQQLHIDGCKGIDHTAISIFMSHAYMLKSLSLKETSLNDDALHEFMGSSLNTLDVSETMVSMRALAYVMKRNPGLRDLKAIGCRNLQQCESKGLTSTSSIGFENIFSELGEQCALEEVAIGWGFSPIALEKLEPALRKLRVMTMGLGASLGHHALYVIPKICPLLESVILKFQVVSDNVVISILESLRHLQVLELCCCLGDLTSISFQINMPKLRTLRLEWVTPWMTNKDLIVLTRHCSNLVELSLSGCKLLDPDSQEIISSGWPGLTFIHLEDCGTVTSNGISSLFDCKAVEDLVLRHNGRGIRRNFIFDAASKLPLLRKVALDMCDACEAGFDSPSHYDKFFLSTVTIARCKSQKCGFGLLRKVHRESIVLEWNSKELRTTVVKERV